MILHSFIVYSHLQLIVYGRTRKTTNYPASFSVITCMLTGKARRYIANGFLSYNNMALKDAG